MPSSGSRWGARGTSRRWRRVSPKRSAPRWQVSPLPCRPRWRTTCSSTASACSPASWKGLRRRSSARWRVKGGSRVAGLLGGGGGLRGHGELPLNADINVTSLVDVAFVLLIIFMITAPIMQGGVDLRLPRADARPLEPKQGLIVTMHREGRIFMDPAALSYADFRATFPAFVRTKRPTGVYLRADGRVPYAEVVQVLA